MVFQLYTVSLETVFQGTRCALESSLQGTLFHNLSKLVTPGCGIFVYVHRLPL